MDSEICDIYIDMVLYVWVWKYLWGRLYIPTHICVNITICIPPCVQFLNNYLLTTLYIIDIIIIYRCANKNLMTYIPIQK